MIRIIYKENCSIPNRNFRKKVTVPFFDRLGLTEKIKAPREMILCTSSLLHIKDTYRGPPGKLMGNSRSGLELPKKSLIFFCYRFFRDPGTYLDKARDVARTSNSVTRAKTLRDTRRGMRHKPLCERREAPSNGLGRVSSPCRAGWI